MHELTNENGGQEQLNMESYEDSQETVTQDKEAETNLEEDTEDFTEEDGINRYIGDEEVPFDEEDIPEDMLEDDEDDFEFESSFDYWKYKVKESPLGKIGGVLAGFVAVVSHIVGTAVRNLLFNGREQLEIKKSFDDALGEKKLKEERKENKEENQNKQTEKEKDPHEKKQEFSEEENKRSPYQQKIYEQLNHFDVSQQPESIPEEWLTEHEEESRDECAQLMANNETVRHLFGKVNCAIEADPNSENFYITGMNEDGKTNESYLMPKEDLLNGNATSLGAILNKFRSEDLFERFPQDAEKREIEMEKAKYQSTIDAVIAVGGARAYSNLQDMADSKRDGIEMQLSQMNVAGPCGAFKLEMVSSLSPEKDIDILYNNDVIKSLKLDELLDRKNLEQEIYDKIHDINEHAADRTFPTKDKIYVEKTEDGFHVTADKSLLGNKGNPYTDQYKTVDLGTYKFEDTVDAWSLSKTLEENQIRCSYDGTAPDYQVFAYSLGLLSNPDMMPVESEKGESLNIFSGEPEQKGQAHMYTQPTPYGLEVYIFLPEKDKKANHMRSGFGFHDNIHLSDQDLRSIYEGMKCAKESIIGNNHEIDKNYNRYQELKGHGNNTYILFPTVGDERVAEALRIKRDINNVLEEKKPEYFMDQEEFKKMINQKANIKLPSEIDVDYDKHIDQNTTFHIFEDDNRTYMADEKEYQNYMQNKANKEDQENEMDEPEAQNLEEKEIQQNDNEEPEL